MANPKYLKKYLEDEDAEPSKNATFSFRLDRNKLEKLKLIAKISNKSVSEILNNQIDELLQDKILNNTYLADEKRIYFYVPTIPQFKRSMFADPGRLQDEYLGECDLRKYNKNYAMDLYDVGERDLFYQLGDPLQVKLNYIPNNLDVWDNERFTYSMLADKERHHGIEPAIITETEPNTEYLINCLYFFYIIYDDSTRETSIYLISSTDALNLAKSCDNMKLLNKIENIIADLEVAEDLETLDALASKYNTGNISRLQKNTESTEPAKIEDIIYKEDDKNEYEILINE